MVPTPLIMLVLTAAFFPGAVAYLVSWPARRLANQYFALLAGISGLMMFVLNLSIFGVHILWLSWVMLAIAIVLIPCSVKLLRKGHAAMRARDRAIAEDRMRRG
jgi:hypothetical protein